MGFEKKRYCGEEREVFDTLEMHKNIKHRSMRIDGEHSKKFEVKVGAHHGSVLSLLLCAVVMDKVIKDIRKVPKQFLGGTKLTNTFKKASFVLFQY